MWGGGVTSRVAGLNAQANSACRSAFGSGAPGSFVLRAMVTVTRASATERRETGARGDDQESIVFLGHGPAGPQAQPMVGHQVREPARPPGFHAGRGDD
jgi:hypothetical protein